MPPPPPAPDGQRGGGGERGLQRSRSVWLRAAHHATIRGLVEQHLLQRLLAAVETLEWPLTIARRASIPLLEQVTGFVLPV